MKKLFLLFGFLTLCYFSQAFAQAANINYKVYGTQVDNIDKIISADVAFFISVADSNNFAGINFRTALLENDSFGDSTIVSLVSPLLDSVGIGAIVVKTLSVSVEAGLTNAQIRTVIDNLYSNEKAKFINTFYIKNDFWRFERIVP